MSEATLNRRKLCMIFNIPSLYRKRIYTNIENTFDTLWNFGENHTDVKEMDLSSFQHVKRWKTRDKGKGIIVMWGLWTLAFKNNIGAYIVIGQPSNISVWLLTILVRLFHPSRKVYFWCHGFYGREKGLGRVFKKIFMKLPHEIFLYGNFAKDNMVKMDFDEKKLHVIHNSLDYDVQLELRKSVTKTNIYGDHFGNNNPTWIFVGRLTPVKQLYLIIEALSTLRNRGANYNMVFVGDGKEREKLEQLVRERGLESRVWFYGACYDEKTNAELIYNADLCVSPGNVGLTAMHMLMFGVPVITHDDFSHQVPEFESVREGITGSFFKRNNMESLVNTITKWFENKGNQRDEVRQDCMQEIDSSWNPYYQMEVLKKNVKL